MLAYSPDATPDFVTEFGGRDGSHILFELKVYNPLVENQTKLRRGAAYAFGATEAYLRSEILGARATASSTSRSQGTTRDGQPRTAKYQEALDAGHDVIPLIHEVFGGVAPEACSYLRRLAALRPGALTAESLTATWSTTSFCSYWGQRISLVLTSQVAQQILHYIEAFAAPAARPPEVV